MAFLSLKQVCATLPLFYTKKTEKDIEKALIKQFPFLATISITIAPYHLTFSPPSSLEAQSILWYRQEIIAFLAEQGIKKQIKIIQ